MPVAVRLLPMGESAWLVETDDLDAVLALESTLRPLAEAGRGVWAEVDDLVPAARTVLVVARPTTDLATLAVEIRRTAAEVDATLAPPSSAVVEVPVRYDGPDLDEVAAHTGLSRDEVVAAHTGTEWRVAFGGFAPGFAYLVGGDPRLVVPRRAEPRTRVPAGAVALAGEFTGIYPRESPGGWQLVGTTDLVLWDAEREPPALLTPGTTVRFTQASALCPAAPQPSSAQPHSTAAVQRRSAQRDDAPPQQTDRARARALEVLDPGPLTLVEDLGRLGHATVGVGRAGAADVGAFLLGNRLLGNVADAPALEATLGGLRLRAHGDLLVCLTGAHAPALLDGRPVGHAALVEVADGQELSLGTPVAGLRTYVCVRGGLDVPSLLGSASSDTMSGLGPPPLRTGQALAVGSRTTGFPVLDAAAVPGPPSGTVELDVVPGPRSDWFADLEELARTTWTVSSRSDRRGVRLDGDPITRRPERRGTELPSEGMVRGAVQVPPNGRPVVLLNDHPVTGGYPVVGVVRAASVDRAAQLQPGQPVRFRWNR